MARFALLLLLLSVATHADPVRIEGGNGQIVVIRNGETTVTAYEEPETNREPLDYEPASSSTVTYASTLPRQWEDRQLENWLRLIRLSYRQHGLYGGHGHRGWERSSRFCNHRASWQVRHVVGRFPRW
jgi:hypothetical protein